MTNFLTLEEIHSLVGMNAELIDSCQINYSAPWGKLRNVEIYLSRPIQFRYNGKMYNERATRDIILGTLWFTDLPREEDYGDGAGLGLLYIDDFDIIIKFTDSKGKRYKRILKSVVVNAVDEEIVTDRKYIFTAGELTDIEEDNG